MLEHGAVGGILTVNKQSVKKRKSKKFLCKGYSQVVYFDWCIIPHTTVCKHDLHKFATLHFCKIVYLQHGGSADCYGTRIDFTCQKLPPLPSIDFASLYSATAFHNFAQLTRKWCAGADCMAL